MAWAGGRGPEPYKEFSLAMAAPLAQIATPPLVQSTMGGIHAPIWLRVVVSLSDLVTRQ